MMGLNKIVGIVIAVIIIGAVAYFALPGFRSKVDSTYDKHFGWTPDARKKNPVGFIDYSIQKLGENITKFEEAKRNLRTQQTALEKMKLENTNRITFADGVLSQLKEAYKVATGENGKGWPVDARGKAYSEAELTTQVKMSLKEKGGYEAILAQAEKGLAIAETRMNELVVRISESRANVDMLKAQRAMVEVNKLSADTEKLLGEVNVVLEENEQAMEARGPETIEEMMRRANSAPTVDADVAKFLAD